VVRVPQREKDLAPIGENGATLMTVVIPPVDNQLEFKRDTTDYESHASIFGLTRLGERCILPREAIAAL